MPKTAIFLAGFFLIIFLLQENSYGFTEGFDAPPLQNFDVELSSNIISFDIPDLEYAEKRYLVFGEGSLSDVYTATKNLAHGIDTDHGFFSVGIFNENQASSLKSKGYNVIEDIPLDFHSQYLSTNAITKISKFSNIAESERVHDLYNITGKGVTVAVVDTGVDFSNPDITDSLARDEFYRPIMFDADGQGLVITNSTFHANVDRYGLLQNYTKKTALPENATSTVYWTKDGVFLDVLQGGNKTKISVYNSFYPFQGTAPVLSGTINGDYKIGKDRKDYITSKSGIYHLGFALSAHIGKLQVIPVLVTDSNEPGVYDTITPDLSTSWIDFTAPNIINVQPDFDFDFTDESPITIGSGNELLLYDSDDDGVNDYSAGTVGARVVDINGIFSAKAEIDDKILAVNGTLLPAIDNEGMFFGIMADYYGHGTASSSTIASKGIMEYDIYNDTKKFTIKGIAPGVNILPVKALWIGDAVYAWLWLSGFENVENKWIYTGEPKADIISNSWGISRFPSLEYAPGLDLSSHILNTLVTPQSLHQNYTGITIVSSAGNSGHGYGTIGMPGISSFGISVGAVTNNDFVGYGPFKDQPRFGNTTMHSNQVVDFSSRGPGVIGDPKPDLMSIGAYGFTPGSITKLPDKEIEPFSLFGGTSMSAPIAAGSAALVIESLNEREMNYDPFKIKSILMSSASNLNNDALTQGAGLVNAHDAVRSVYGHAGKFIVHNNATFSNINKVIDIPLSSFDSELVGIDKLDTSDKTFPNTSWFGGRLKVDEKTSTTFTIENPTDKPLDVTIKPVTLKLIERLEMSGTTEPHLQDPILNDEDVYRPNYIKLGNLPAEHTVSNPNSIIHPDASLMLLDLNFDFDIFMNKTDTRYADDLKIASLYIYDWKDANNNTKISSDELSLVNRGGSWGTVQEIRITNPAEKFENEPVIGIYPVPSRYSFWTGNINQNTTSIDYTLITSYYADDLWTDVVTDTNKVTIPPNNSTKISASISVPADRQTGVYQGFVNFEGEHHTVQSPVSYVVLKEVTKDTKPIVIMGSQNDVLFGNGYVKGAFDMTSRYMAGDWRQYYFDIQDPTINAAAIDFSWENENTNFTVFMMDPKGKIIQTNHPPGVIGHFWGWPTGDWLGTSSFSQGGAFFPLKNKDKTSTVLYAPVNQTGTYTLLVHSTLFGGEETTESISLAAQFTTIIPDNMPPEIIFTMPELIDRSFKIKPEIVEKNLEFVKYYLDGKHVEVDVLESELLSDGEHNLRIFARDILGYETEKTFSFSVDNTPPEILVKLPKNGTKVSHSLEIDFEVNDPNLAESWGITIMLPGDKFLNDITSHSLDTTNFADGTYDITIVARDLLDNKHTQTISFDVDHSLVQAISSESKSSVPQDMILIIISIIVAAGVLTSIIMRNKRKDSKMVKS